MVFLVRIQTVRPNDARVGPASRSGSRQKSGRCNETFQFREGTLARMSEVTRILSAIEQGDPHAAEHLLPLVYEELRKLAASKLAGEAPGQTLQATALVHEAYVRLVGDEPSAGWAGRRHFFAAAAEAMRRILVERARHKGRQKHGGGRRRVDLDEAALPADERGDDLVALDEALTEFAVKQPARAELVQLRYFAGLTLEQAADALGISRATAARHWTFARAWLYDRIRRQSG
jgi:RNA polymerase sigma factor (TIGR02999 family)